MPGLTRLVAAGALSNALEGVELDACERTSETAPVLSAGRGGDIAALAELVDRPSDHGIHLVIAGADGSDGAQCFDPGRGGPGQVDYCSPAWVVALQRIEPELLRVMCPRELREGER